MAQEWENPSQGVSKWQSLMILGLCLGALAYEVKRKPVRILGMVGVAIIEVVGLLGVVAEWGKASQGPLEHGYILFASLIVLLYVCWHKEYPRHYDNGTEPTDREKGEKGDSEKNREK